MATAEGRQPILLDGYDFVDFGCSGGGSMAFAAEHMAGMSGLGLDIDPAKIAAAKARGLAAAVADLREPTHFRGQVRFAILSHFLEHLPGLAETRAILATAAAISAHQVLIRQPWFDTDGLLAHLGVKLFWSDWTGHTNPISSLQLYLLLARMLDAGRIGGFAIYGHEPVTHTKADCVIPLASARDQHHYDAAKHGPKPLVPIEAPCFRELVALIAVDAQLDPPILPDPIRRVQRLLAGGNLAPLRVDQP